VVVVLAPPQEGGVVHQPLDETADCQQLLEVVAELVENHHIQVVDALDSGPSGAGVVAAAVAAAGSTVPSVPVPFFAEPITLPLLPNLDLHLEFKKMFPCHLKANQFFHFRTPCAFIAHEPISTRDSVHFNGVIPNVHVSMREKTDCCSSDCPNIVQNLF